MSRLTRWEGQNSDGSPRVVLAKREGLFPDNLQEALVKLAKFEDWQEHNKTIPGEDCNE